MVDRGIDNSRGKYVGKTVSCPPSQVASRGKALKQRPIPEDWHTHKSRSALREELRINRGATHPVNATLNYAYGVLIGRAQVQLFAEGYDPTIGILHGRENERGMYPAFALDRMEPMRPIVDRAVLQVIRDVTFTATDFLIQQDGVCRLNPELARRVTLLAIDVLSTTAAGASRREEPT
jgi:CRISP-associated protein Cas1